MSTSQTDGEREGIGCEQPESTGDTSPHSPPSSILPPSATSPTSLIGAVPLKVLRTIFQIHNDMIGPEVTVSLWAAPKLLVVGQVCRSWRNLALSSPLLWTYIDIRKPQLAREFLSRSNSKPLWLCAPAMDYPFCKETPNLSMVYGNYPPSFQETFRNHTSCIQIIHLKLRPMGLELVCSLAPFPRLTDMLIKNAHTNYFDWRASFLISMSRYLFVGYDALSKFSWFANDSMNIVPEELVVDMSDLLQCLAHSPQLKCLDLSGIRVLSRKGVDYPVIPLPNLRQLYIEDYYSATIMHLISRLSTSPSTLCLFQNIDSTSLRPLLLSPTQFPNLQIDETVTLQLSPVSLMLIKEARCPWASAWEGRLQLYLQYLSEGTACRNIPDILRSLKLTSIKTIEIDGGVVDFMTESDIRNLLLASPGLETLRVSHTEDIYKVFNALGHRYPDAPKGPCPMLNTFSLGGRGAKFVEPDPSVKVTL